MNSIIPPAIAPFMNWLGTQIAAMRTVIGALITGASMPARQTLLYTFVLIVILYFLVRIFTRKKKPKKT